MSPYSFNSALAPTITAFLTLKKALGRRYSGETTALAQLDRFLAAQYPGQAALSCEAFAAWTLSLANLTPTVRRGRMRIVRNLCLYAARTEPGRFVPDPAGFPAPHQARRPHIFTEHQIALLLDAATNLRPTNTAPLRAEVFRLAVVLLYTAGLRREEVVRLALSDYDPAERTLLIRASKFHKSRLIALSAGATGEMERYLRARLRFIPHSADAPLLVNRRGGLRAYCGAGLGMGLRALFQVADIRTAEGRFPRVHDIRHTYAVHALLCWYRAGADVQNRLPALSAAMGHVSPASTAHYLAFLPPVAEAASDRFEQHWQRMLGCAPDGGDRK